MEGDFDPAEYDSKMATMFNDEYYDGVRIILPSVNRTQLMHIECAGG